METHSQCTMFVNWTVNLVILERSNYVGTKFKSVTKGKTFCSNICAAVYEVIFIYQWDLRCSNKYKQQKQKSLAVGIVIASNAHCGAFYISVQMLREGIETSESTVWS